MFSSFTFLLLIKNSSSFFSPILFYNNILDTDNHQNLILSSNLKYKNPSLHRKLKMKKYKPFLFVCIFKHSQFNYFHTVSSCLVTLPFVHKSCIIHFLTVSSLLRSLESMVHHCLTPRSVYSNPVPTLSSSSRLYTACLLKSQL